jgi:hypothetical protein
VDFRDVASGANVNTFVPYSLAGGDFHCFEPGDHPLNAAYLPGGAASSDMATLQLPATLRLRFVLGR